MISRGPCKCGAPSFPASTLPGKCPHVFKILFPTKSSGGFWRQKKRPFVLFRGRGPGPPPVVEKGRLRCRREAPQKLYPWVLVWSPVQPTHYLFPAQGVAEPPIRSRELRGRTLG